MKKLQIGDRVPDVSVTFQDGKSQSLSDLYHSKVLVLFFYPKNHTPLCTKEACAFRDAYEAFTEAGAEVVGVSKADSGSHQSFIDKHRLPFPLIVDQKDALRKAFRVPRALGILPGRVTYVIDGEGVIRHLINSATSANKHVDDALGVVKGLLVA